MVRERKLELADGELLTWPVQVWSLVVVLSIMFALAVFLVCLYFKLFGK